MTDCRQEKLTFQGICGRRVEGCFDGAKLSTDGGLLLVREVAEGQRFFSRLVGCFRDYRLSEAVTHSVESLVKQRLYGLIAGYEDVCDHDTLRHDPIMQLVSDVVPGEHQLASHSTLSRMEASAKADDRYKKIDIDDDRFTSFLVDEFVRYAKRTGMKELVLDVDATDIPLHGHQEERFFHGYYGHYCYLPLYIFCEEFPLWAELRPSNIDGSLGTVEALEKIVPKLRAALPDATITIRGDSGFAREHIMEYCEKSEIHYVFGLARNARLEAEIDSDMAAAKASFELTKKATRVFRDFSYRTLDTWSRARRVVAKAEYLEKGPNPRFVVTTLSCPAQELYEERYCKRGDAENRIKEQFQLFAYRTSCKVKRGNQIRLWFSTLAYLLVVLVKKYRLKNTELERAEVHTIRTRLVKLAVKVTVSVRRVYLSFAEAFPLQHLFHSALTAST